MMNCPKCNVSIDEHEAGRCLDAWVADVVMGYPHSDSMPYGYGNAWLDEAHAYSRSIAAAWEVVEKLYSDKHWHLEFERTYHWEKEQSENWWVTIGNQDATAPTAPLAICRAAIKAVQ